MAGWNIPIFNREIHRLNPGPPFLIAMLDDPGVFFLCNKKTINQYDHTKSGGRYDTNPFDPSQNIRHPIPIPMMDP